MAIKKINIKGGYSFKNIKGAPEHIIETVAIPSRIIIPLKQGAGPPLKPLVKTGDHVTAGQIIARDDDVLSTPVQSSVSGEVVETTKTEYLGEKKVPTVVIVPDARQEETRLEGSSEEWEKLSAEKMGELLYLSGVSALGNSGLPTTYNSAPINRDEVRRIIIHGTDSDLWEPLPTVLLAKPEDYKRFVEGVRILQRFYNGCDTHIALNGSFRTILQSLETDFQGNAGVRLYQTQSKYPHVMEEALVPSILETEFATRFSAIHMGILVVDIQTVQQVYDAVALGRCLTTRTIALAGPGHTSNPHLSVKIGTSVSHITAPYLREGETRRVVRNSLIRGAIWRDMEQPLDKNCSSIIGLVEATEGELLSFARPGFVKDSYSNTFFSLFAPFKRNIDTNIHGEKRSCINCGFCVEVCPVRILPNLLHRYVERKIIDETLVRFKIFSCIQCNLCTYVCPSKIRVAGLLQEGMDALVAEGLDPAEAMILQFELKGVEQKQQEVQA